jgi:hypothetical protein
MQHTVVAGCQSVPNSPAGRRAAAQYTTLRPREVQNQMTDPTCGEPSRGQRAASAERETRWSRARAAPPRAARGGTRRAPPRAAPRAAATPDRTARTEMRSRRCLGGKRGKYALSDRFKYARARRDIYFYAKDGTPVPTGPHTVCCAPLLVDLLPPGALTIGPSNVH